MTVSETSRPAAVVGLDIGHSAVKMTYESQDGKPARSLWPALACPAITITNPLEAQRVKADTVTVDGKPYFVGATARLQSQADLPVGLRDDWIETPEHAALIAMAAKIVQEEGGPDVSRLWVIGLPVVQYARDASRLATIAERLLPPTDRVKVMQQPDAVYYGRIYTRDGLPAPGVSPDHEAWAVVDIGYYTTDVVLYERGRYIEAAAARYDGMRGVVEAIQRELALQGLDRSIVEIEEAMPRGVLMHRGQPHDFSAEVRRAVDYFTAKIIEETGRVMGRRINALNGILVAGGGASLTIEPFQRVWPHAQLAQDIHHEPSKDGTALHGSRFAIAEGYYRYGRSVLVLEQYAKGGGL